MALPLTTRFKKAFNVFLNRSSETGYEYYGSSYGYRPDHRLTNFGNDKSIITALYNRIAVDGAAIDIRHVRLDENDRYKEDIDSGLNNCLTLEANIDQTGREFVHDVILSMLDEGCVAIVPVDTDEDPDDGSFEIFTMRVGKIIDWYPRHIKVSLYNDLTGEREDVTVSKEKTVIVENPFYAVFNEPNSNLKRLKRKLALLDLLDERIGSGKLDVIIQLPYVIKNETKHQQAVNRRKEIEDQLTGSQYGIAYIDGTEHITQLNRPVENAFVTQVENLTNMVYSQLGMTKEILDGTADPNTMQNYYTRIIEPILSNIVDDMKRKFLSKTARTQKQSIMFFRDPLTLIPVSEVASVADTFTRNEILSSNEIRQLIGRKPSTDPSADELRNKNLNQSKEDMAAKQNPDSKNVEKIIKENLGKEM